LNKKPTNETNAKPQPVNKEAFHLLATEIGLNEACRKLGVPIPTGKSWARRGGWKLPKRTGGRPGRTLSASSASSLHPIADALVETHKDLEATTKTALMQTLAKAAQHVAQKQALDVSNTAQLRDICLAAARLFGWDGSPLAPVTVNADKAQVLVCDEATRMKLIKLREELQGSRPEALPGSEQPEPVKQTREAEVADSNGTPTATPEPQSDLYRWWLTAEKAEPEPGPEYEI
jgi:hypothetical protein